MRIETKRSYENRIKELETKLQEQTDRADTNANRARMMERSYHDLHEARRQGEWGRQWAVERAIEARQPDVVGAARQIADFVYGPDSGPDREAENPS